MGCLDVLLIHCDKPQASIRSTLFDRVFRSYSMARELHADVTVVSATRNSAAYEHIQHGAAGWGNAVWCNAGRSFFEPRRSAWTRWVEMGLSNQRHLHDCHCSGRLLHSAWISGAPKPTSQVLLDTSTHRNSSCASPPGQEKTSDWHNTKTISALLYILATLGYR